MKGREDRSAEREKLIERKLMLLKPCGKLRNSSEDLGPDSDPTQQGGKTSPNPALQVCRAPHRC